MELAIQTIIGYSFISSFGSLTETIYKKKLTHRLESKYLETSCLYFGEKSCPVSITVSTEGKVRPSSFANFMKYDTNADVNITC